MDEPFPGPVPTFSLTPEERQSIAIMLTSPAWTTLRDKVWLHLRRMAVTNLVEAKSSDFTHLQGYYAGLRMAEAAAVVCSQPEKKQTDTASALESKLTPKQQLGGLL